MQRLSSTIKTDLKNGDLAMFIRLGSDVKNNYYEYEIPLDLTPPGRYNNFNSHDRTMVWPLNNRLDIPLDVFTTLKTERNREKSAGTEGVGYNVLYSSQDSEIRVIWSPCLETRVSAMCVSCSSVSETDRAALRRAPSG